ncbi:hypothetical protein FJ959_08700 [Mesorhizobium sp. B2-2-4]|uniref:hypothetical protein n=1 Tax=Mesorhizobium sp. B2-2-4 TaxID=2589962 RepID=UPI00112D07BF|nr:hypothetical protein [Mesorhizobium sp. B2-2-4]TPM58945.1 hypothetical protein FJ959_08700 [Mesorhizobium sp. B2-2-4]
MANGNRDYFTGRYMHGPVHTPRKSDREVIDALVAALDELADLMDGTVSGDYVPDSFTTQPARAALALARKGG